MEAIVRTGPRTASELVFGIYIAKFDGHDKLASYCGLEIEGSFRAGIRWARTK